MVGAVLYFYPDFQEYNTLSTIPFVKDANIDYAFLGEALGWAIYIPVCIFILTAVSNSVNLTDGLDVLPAEHRPLPDWHSASWHMYPAASTTPVFSTFSICREPVS